MRIESDPAATRAASLAAKAAGRTVGFVPTMGALHAGHESLVAAARAECGFVAVSVFVNPTQFGPAEDLSRYPRTFDADAEMCRRHGVDLIFAPGPAEMYPRPTAVWVVPERIVDGLCGAARPGHFRGVATVVAKLFNIVQPDVAYFGQKDAQQCAVIRRMVADLDFPVRIDVRPTVREPDGLAMSSRNKYLLGDDRRHALCLWRALSAARDLAAAGEDRTAPLLAEMQRVVGATPGTRPDYFAAVDPDTMEPVERIGDRPVLLALAVHVGPARLIDNLLLARG